MGQKWMSSHGEDGQEQLPNFAAPFSTTQSLLSPQRDNLSGKNWKGNTPYILLNRANAQHLSGGEASFEKCLKLHIMSH